MKERKYVRAEVSEKCERSLEAGHPWVFAEEIRSLIGTAENGELVDVVGQKGKYLGTGFINDRSKIRVRILSRNANDAFDEAFFKRRLRYAWEYRKRVLGGKPQACRLVFGEADMFPGLTVDRFGAILVAQVLSYGIEKRKETIFNALAEVLEEDGEKIEGLYERNDVSIRKLEGMEENKGFFPLTGKEIPDFTGTYIEENGIKYFVDFAEGQKTGFFLDQRFNRLRAAKLAEGAEVLDCFTHTGSFALNAARAGAKSVLAADISAPAIETAKENARLNGLEDKISFEVADAFELLPRLEEEKRKFDLVILDPPAFTKSRRTIESAMRGYREINCRGLKLTRRGGYFATCSCSHFATEEMFVKMLKAAALQAGVQLRQIERAQQSPDHPVLWNVPETDYLKFFTFQVV